MTDFRSVEYIMDVIRDFDDILSYEENPKDFKFILKCYIDFYNKSKDFKIVDMLKLIVYENKVFGFDIAVDTLKQYRESYILKFKQFANRLR